LGTYVYDQEWREERERLAGMERLWDPGTQAIVASLGLGAGWHCLEIGAGGGSVAEWLADRVGEDGRVVATDVSTKYLQAVERPNVEVLEHDVLRDGLEEQAFDLVYARLVVEHLGAPALERMLGAVRPGGLLLLEDYDFGAAAAHPPDELYEKVVDAILDFMAEAGFDPLFGRRLVALLDAAGLEDVRAEGRARVYRGGSPETAFGRLSLESLGEPLVAAGRLSRAEVDEALRRIEDPTTTYVSPLMVAAWGRRPVGGPA
jgi:SAM-dependent methyltransferase